MSSQPTVVSGMTDHSLFHGQVLMAQAALITTRFTETAYPIRTQVQPVSQNPASQMQQGMSIM